MFDRFYRSPDAEGTGSGLGLSIVKSVAQAHGGQVALGVSDTLRGLKVTVTLPAARRSAQAG